MHYVKDTTGFVPVGCLPYLQDQDKNLSSIY